MKTTSKRSLLVASREAGSARAPRLVVETAAAGGGPGPMPQTTPELTHEAGPDFERRPYTDGSPWNTKLPAGVPVNPNSAAAIATIGGPLTSDTGQYTYPLYLVDSSAPLRPVSLSGLYSDVRGGQNDDSLLRQSEATVNVPISAEMDAANGSDAQIIIVNPSTGDEWGFWKLRKNSGGNWSATNGYHYNVRWDAHPPRDSSDRAFGSRGAGVPYFAGLVRPWEIRLGRVDHALAFAYDYPSYEWIYPASKSDGNSAPPALPEGARLQLDPSLTETELRGRGCNTTAVTIARAMQEYGMYVIDNSGSDKIMLEYSGTADWAGLGAERSTPSCIPVDRLRWVDWR